MPNLTDLSTIRDVCARHDFALSKGFGQNFIINPGICPRIAEAAGIGPGWGALEVGPGIGVLTEQLCKRADKVVRSKWTNACRRSWPRQWPSTRTLSWCWKMC